MREPGRCRLFRQLSLVAPGALTGCRKDELATGGCPLCISLAAMIVETGTPRARGDDCHRGAGREDSLVATKAPEAALEEASESRPAPSELPDLL